MINHQIQDFWHFFWGVTNPSAESRGVGIPCGWWGNFSWLMRQCCLGCLDLRHRVAQGVMILPAEPTGYHGYVK